MATVASASADVVNFALENVAESDCALALSMFPGDKGAFSVVLTGPVQRQYTEAIVTLDGDVVTEDRYRLYWLSDQTLVIKTLLDGQPFLPSSFEIAIDETVP